MSSSRARWLTSQLYRGCHLGSPSPTTQGYHPAMVGNQDPQPPLRPMEPTMAQYQASCQPLPHLPRGHLQPQQHRALEDRQPTASLAKKMHRMGQAPLSRCTGTLGLSHPGQPHGHWWSASHLTSALCPPPTKAQVTAHLAGMQVGRAVAPVPPTVRLGYGPPTSAGFPNPGLYGPYPQG